MPRKPDSNQACGQDARIFSAGIKCRHCGSRSSSIIIITICSLAVRRPEDSASLPPSSYLHRNSISYQYHRCQLQQKQIFPPTVFLARGSIFSPPGSGHFTKSILTSTPVSMAKVRSGVKGHWGLFIIFKPYV